MLLLTTCVVFAGSGSGKDLGLHSDGGAWRFCPAKLAKGDLPKVLLIGDSIMNGYRESVIAALKGKASVDCWLTPLHLASEELHHDLIRVLEQGPYDVIHFNVGLHGWTPGRIKDGQYEPLLREYVEIVRSHSESTKLIWGSTTQITVKGKPTQLDPTHNTTIAKRNVIADKVMPEYGVVINDLYGLLIDKLGMARGDKYHWKGPAYGLMANQIVKHVEDALVAAAPPQVYISPLGSDKNVGSKASPFRTLERARDEARKINIEGIRTLVFLREGMYERSSTFELGPQDSLTTYRSYPGEKVNLVGGKNISANNVRTISDDAISSRIIDENARRNALEIDLKKCGVTDFGKMRPRGFRRPYIPSHLELFINGEAMSLSRWPNKGEPRIKIGKVLDKGSIPRNGDFSNRGGTFHFSTSRPDLWKDAGDILISGFFNNGYADDTINVESIDLEKKTISTVQPHMYSFRSGRAWNSWFALNLLEEIDQPGEFFCDTQKGMLYFNPPKGYEPKTASIQVSILEEPMITLEDAERLHIKGITLECTRGMGVYIEKGSSCRIIGCTLRNMGIVAACIGQGTEDLEHYAHEGSAPAASRRLGSWHEQIYSNPAFERKGGKDHGIISCDIYNTGAGAVHIGGGDRKTLDPAGNFIRNCHIYDFNRLGRSYKAGVNIDGVGNRIEHCNIHSAPAVAVYLHGNDHILEYNEIHHVMEDGDDMGGFYMGRDPAEFGNLIKHNFFHHIGRTPQTHRTWGVYYDDMACGTRAIGNVFYKTGKKAAFLIGGGKYNDIINNIFIECGLCVQLDNRGQSWGRGMLKKGELFEQRTLKHVNALQPPYSEKYPQLAGYWQDNPGKPDNPILNNLAVKCGKLTNARADWGTVSNNWMTAEDPGFADMAKGDFSLSEKSIVFSKIPGFKPVPFEEMGMYKDSWIKEIPERDGFATEIDNALR